MINIEEAPIINNRIEINGLNVNVLFIGSQNGIKSRIDSFLTIFPPIEATVIVIVKAKIDVITCNKLVFLLFHISEPILIRPIKYEAQKPNANPLYRNLL